MGISLIVIGAIIEAFGVVGEIKDVKRKMDEDKLIKSDLTSKRLEWKINNLVAKITGKNAKTR